MYCPYCGCENSSDTAFCKNCGSAIRNNPNMPPNRPQQNYNQNNNNNKSILIICITLIIIAVIAASAFVLLNNNGGSNPFSNNNTTIENNVASSAASANSAQSIAGQTEVGKQDSSMLIQSGSFSTGSSLSDKTHCKVYVGKEHAGQQVKISVLYSRDGSNLNEGKIVPITVDSSGYVSVASASSFKYYPDNGYITLYDSQGNVLDTRNVNMNAASGTQYF